MHSVSSRSYFAVHSAIMTCDVCHNNYYIDYTVIIFVQVSAFENVLRCKKWRTQTLPYITMICVSKIIGALQFCCDDSDNNSIDLKHVFYLFIQFDFYVIFTSRVPYVVTETMNYCDVLIRCPNHRLQFGILQIRRKIYKTGFACLPHRPIVSGVRCPVKSRSYRRTGRTDSVRRCVSECHHVLCGLGQL